MQTLNNNMSIFTNKSTVELIPQNEINSDFGVLLFRSASFNKFDKSKYQNPDGTPNDLAVKKIYECLIRKHRSVFFGSRLNFMIDIYSKNRIEQPHNLQDLMGFHESWGSYSISIYLALKWLYERPVNITDGAYKIIENGVKLKYPACYQALQILIKEKPPREIGQISDDCQDLEFAKSLFISFKIQLPIFIARQLYRHRGINFTERSGRYTAENIQFFNPDAWRKAPKKATQGSMENEFVEEALTEYECDGAGTGFGHDTEYSFKTLSLLNLDWYGQNLKKGVCKEQARMILPQSQITTTINTVDLYTLSSVLSQRLDKHAQKETRDLAQQLYDIACQEFGKELVDKLIDIQKRLIF